MPDATTQIFLRTKRKFWSNGDVAMLSHNLPIQPCARTVIDWAEVTLRAGFSHEFQAIQDYLVLLVPLVGEIHLENDITLDVCQSWGRLVKEGETLLIQNHYSSAENHFLLIQIPFSETVKATISSFSKYNLQNGIYQIFSLNQGNLSLRLGMGEFDGRANTEFDVKGSVYAYCLVGAFEVQNCLMEKGDALKITNTQKVELEALSSGAVLLTLEM